MFVAFAALATGCDTETSILIETEFDRSIQPGALGQLVFVIEPVDGTGFDGMPVTDASKNGIRVRVTDVDGDGYPERLYHASREAVTFHTGGRFRLEPGTLPVGADLRFTALAADWQSKQIGEGSAVASFVEGEEVLVRIRISCFCEGRVGCTPEGTRLCGPSTEQNRCDDLLDNDVEDDAVDCADPDCHHRPGPCEGCGPEDCTTRGDESCDGLADCSDPKCATALTCRGCTPERCVGGVDEDCDTLVDCADPDCERRVECKGCNNPAPTEIDCYDRVDNDCDGLIDCRDCKEGDCPCPRPLWPQIEVDCDNGFDEDCDGFTDCFDEDCFEAALCRCPALVPEVCMDRFDSDCDGKTDCEDEDCIGARVPEVRSGCTDGIDNDCNGSIDCADSSCRNNDLDEDCFDLRDNDCDDLVDCRDTEDCPALATPEICFDLIDNNCDGHTDCADPACATGGENCTNRRDDNCDGKTDCSDRLCAGGVGGPDPHPDCAGSIPEICTNEADDDEDLLVDCDDEDCRQHADCDEVL